MSTLLVIRHGQASFGADDYDTLSELGVTQSRRLGAHLAATGQSPDALYTGPRVRHVDTARRLAAAAQEVGVGCPEPIVLPELDEYPAEMLVRRHLPRLMADDGTAAPFVPAGSDPLGDRALFQRVLEHVLGGWARGELATAGVESFEAFTGRVRRGLARIMAAEGRGKRVAVVTSAGPVSVAMQLALSLSDAMALRMSWVVANASITEFRYREELLTLTGFNALPHLTARELVSYR